MPHHKEVDSLAPMHPNDEQVSNDQGGTEILGVQLEGQMQNISFDESHHRVVQSHIVEPPKDQTSPTQVEEQVIVTNVHNHPVDLAYATRVYTEATS